MALRESLTFWKLVRGDWKSSLRKLITQGQMESHGCPGTVHHSLPAFTRRRCPAQCGERAGGRRQERLSVTAPSLLQQVGPALSPKASLTLAHFYQWQFRVPSPQGSYCLLPPLAAPSHSAGHTWLSVAGGLGKSYFWGGWSPFQTGDLSSACTAYLFIWLFCKKEIN